MGKYQNDGMLDAALNYIVNNAASVVLLTNWDKTDTATYNFTNATTTYGGAGGGLQIASAAITGADFAGAVDGVNGRKLVVPSRSDVTIDATATATHVAVLSGTEVLYVTTCVAQPLTATNLVTIPQWEIEMYDAA